MTGTLRILKITGAYPPAYVHGGTVTAAHSLCKSLLALGHEVSVLTTDINGGTRLNAPEQWTTWEGVPVRYCRWIRSPLPYLSLELPRELQRNAGSYDIVLLDSAWTGYGVLAGWMCRQVGLPYIVYAHGCHGPARMRKSSLKKRLWWWAFDRNLYNRAAAVVALSRAEISDLRALGIRTRIECIPNGVDLHSLEHAESRGELEKRFPSIHGRRIVLFLGRLEPIKGLDLLIPAFARVHEENPETMLIIVGPSERGYRRKVEELVRDHELSTDVLFTGLLTGPTKVGFLYSAEVFVLPSYGEGLSMSALEALACGVPVILTEPCNLPEVEEVKGGLVVPVSVGGVEAGLRQVLRDPDLSKRMGARGRQLVTERFTWRRIALQTSKLCEEIVAAANTTH